MPLWVWFLCMGKNNQYPKRRGIFPTTPTIGLEFPAAYKNPNLVVNTSTP
ncbi:hypothetical protein [aff. Roholtiella sp. LEGE 12411]|nr:hypothetical protein [aff. Roholtiella sp. LEGE 12411]MBE9038888.1 hypothetical protein [aff. Roholtiella sp. LEGE 12411]